MVYIAKNGVSYEKHTGTRAEVHNGIAFSTNKSASGLTKADIVVVDGVYITKKQHDAALKRKDHEEEVRRRAVARSSGVKRVGNRADVYAGRALMTQGRLTKDELVLVDGEVLTVREARTVGATPVAAPANDATMLTPKLPELPSPTRPHSPAGTGYSDPDANLMPQWDTPSMVAGGAKDLGFFVGQLAALREGDPAVGVCVAMAGKLYLLSGQIVAGGPGHLNPEGAT
jgi:hypothetical protein